MLKYSIVSARARDCFLEKFNVGFVVEGDFGYLIFDFFFVFYVCVGVCLCVLCVLFCV